MGRREHHSIKKLTQLMQGVLLYANVNNGIFPPTLEILVPDFVASIDTLSSPFSHDIVCSYAYYGAGLTSGTVEANQIIIEDLFAVYEELKIVAYSDGHVESSKSLVKSLESIAPAHGSVGGGTEVKIKGHRFKEGATVMCDGIAATSIVVEGRSRITAVVPAHFHNTVSVIVTNPDGTQYRGAFTYSGVHLVVTPDTNFEPSGDQGGPFSPSSTTYTLTNICDEQMNFTVSTQGFSDWLTVSFTEGILTAGASERIEISLNSNADLLPAGVYVEQLDFTNTTNGSGSAGATITLSIAEVV